jgi:hypothetical protein
MVHENGHLLQWGGVREPVNKTRNVRKTQKVKGEVVEVAIPSQLVVGR